MKSLSDVNLCKPNSSIVLNTGQIELVKPKVEIA